VHEDRRERFVVGGGVVETSKQLFKLVCEDCRSGAQPPWNGRVVKAMRINVNVDAGEQVSMPTIQ